VSFTMKKKSKPSKGRINFDWENERAKLLFYMQIPAKKKLEWLRQMHEFTVKTSSKRMLALRWKLRESR